MKKFAKNFMLGAATAAHQVEGNNIHSDYWAQEQLPHSMFNEPSLDAVDHYNRSGEQYEAAKVSGANRFQIFVYITLPQMKTCAVMTANSPFTQT